MPSPAAPETSPQPLRLAGSSAAILTLAAACWVGAIFLLQILSPVLDLALPLARVLPR